MTQVPCWRRGCNQGGGAPWAGKKPVAGTSAKPGLVAEFAALRTNEDMVRVFGCAACRHQPPGRASPEPVTTGGCAAQVHVWPPQRPASNQRRHGPPSLRLAATLHCRQIRTDPPSVPNVGYGGGRFLRATTLGHLVGPARCRRRRRNQRRGGRPPRRNSSPPIIARPRSACNSAPRPGSPRTAPPHRTSRPAAPRDPRRLPRAPRC